MVACQYKHYSLGLEDFACEEPLRTKDSNYCVFHDTGYRLSNYPDYERQATKRLDERIKNEEFPRFIGFSLPANYLAIKLFEENKIQSIDFTGALFIGPANFGSREFKFEETIFRETEFEGEMYFHGTHFGGKVDFSDAKFKNIADFSLATFKTTANFVSTEFQEVYFVDTKFEKGATFSK